MLLKGLVGLNKHIYLIGILLISNFFKLYLSQEISGELAVEIFPGLRPNSKNPNFFDHSRISLSSVET